jgi:hypothetical protein
LTNFSTAAASASVAGNRWMIWPGATLRSAK